MQIDEKNFEISEVSESECARIEARLWIVHCLNHSNPALHEIASFLVGYFELDEEYGLDKNRTGVNLGLSAVQLLEAQNWFAYFQKHSLVGLQEVAESLAEWLDAETMH